MHCTRAVLHTFAGKLGRETERHPAGTVKDRRTLIWPRPDLGSGGEEARMAREQVFFASRAIKGESEGVGSALKNAHALCLMHKMNQLSV